MKKVTVRFEIDQDKFRELQHRRIDAGKSLRAMLGEVIEAGIRKLDEEKRDRPGR